MTQLTVPISSLEVGSSSSGSRSLEKVVEDQRKFVLEACLVRVMKARKVLSHPEVLVEVTRQVTSFQPQPKAIKAAIESLIEREYLERDQGDSKLYKYLA